MVDGLLAHPPDRIEDVILRRELDRIASQQFDSELVGFTRTPFPVVGSYSCYAISVMLRDGSSRPIFLKDFGQSRQSKDRPKARRRRELHVYRDLLAGARLGTPSYYGSVCDPRAGHFWLLIELVKGEPVSEANLAYGTLAATWLAQMQAHFAAKSDRLTASEHLRHLDADFFRETAVRAISDVASLSSTEASRLETVLPLYESAIPSLITGPRTLVHGGFIPWHLLVDRTHEPVRVCVYDWELAAVGSPLYDLAYFLDDADARTQELIVDSYLAESARQGLPLPDDQVVRAAVDSLRLHRVMDWLSRSVEKDHSAAKLEWLIERALNMGRKLRL